jgi:hypothetical protein
MLDVCPTGPADDATGPTVNRTQGEVVGPANDRKEYTPFGRRTNKPPLLAGWMPTSLPRAERVARARFLVETAAPGRYNLFGH